MTVPRAGGVATAAGTAAVLLLLLLGSAGAAGLSKRAHKALDPHFHGHGHERDSIAAVLRLDKSPDNLHWARNHETGIGRTGLHDYNQTFIDTNFEGICEDDPKFIASNARHCHWFEFNRDLCVRLGARSRCPRSCHACPDQVIPFTADESHEHLDEICSACQDECKVEKDIAEAEEHIGGESAEYALRESAEVFCDTGRARWGFEQERCDNVQHRMDQVDSMNALLETSELEVCQALGFCAGGAEVQSFLQLLDQAQAAKAKAAMHKKAQAHKALHEALKQVEPREITQWIMEHQPHKRLSPALIADVAHQLHCPSDPHNVHASLTCLHKQNPHKITEHLSKMLTANPEAFHSAFAMLQTAATAGLSTAAIAALIAKACGPSPTPSPTVKPPTKAPTTKAPTTKAPTPRPTRAPTTKAPTPRPTQAPTTKAPTNSPTPAPTTKHPTKAPIFVDNCAAKLADTALDSSSLTCSEIDQWIACFNENMIANGLTPTTLSSGDLVPDSFLSDTFAKFSSNVKLPVDEIIMNGAVCTAPVSFDVHGTVSATDGFAQLDGLWNMHIDTGYTIGKGTTDDKMLASSFLLMEDWAPLEELGLSTKDVFTLTAKAFSEVHVNTAEHDGYAKGLTVEGTTVLSGPLVNSVHALTGIDLKGEFPVNFFAPVVDGDSDSSILSNAFMSWDIGSYNITNKLAGASIMKLKQLSASVPPELEFSTALKKVEIFGQTMDLTVSGTATTSGFEYSLSVQASVVFQGGLALRVELVGGNEITLAGMYLGELALGGTFASQGVAAAAMLKLQFDSGGSTQTIETLAQLSYTPSMCAFMISFGVEVTLPDISLNDVVKIFSGNDLPTPFNTVDISFTLDRMSLAGREVTLGSVTLQKGFELKAAVKLLDFKMSVDAAIIFPSSGGTDFKFDFSFTWDTDSITDFLQDLCDKLNDKIPSQFSLLTTFKPSSLSTFLGGFGIRTFSITEFSSTNLKAGTFPRVTLIATIKDTDRTLLNNVRIPSVDKLTSKVWNMIGGADVPRLLGLCVKHSDCASDKRCDYLTLKCESKLNNGDAGCFDAGACTSPYCVMGFCRQCTAHSHCASNQYCSNVIPEVGGSCLTKKGNGMSNVCVEDRWCQSGHCVAGFCQECESHSHCSSTEFCQPQLGGTLTCEAKKGNGYFGCVDSNWCQSSLQGGCVLGVCRQCSSHSHCTSSQYCSDVLGSGGSCNTREGNGYVGCLDNRWCSASLSAGCKLGVCRQCDSHSHCTSDQYCSDVLGEGGSCNGKKGLGGTCVSDRWCKSGSCFGACVCASDSDCSSGKVCNGAGSARACITKVVSVGGFSIG